LSGILKHQCPDSVNFVNALVVAKERGIRVVESRSERAGQLTNLVTITLRGSGDETVVAGAVFGRDEKRLVRFNASFLEAAAEGCLLVITNDDLPGIVGRWGTLLGEHRINISQMQLALDSGKGKALAIVNIDTPAPEEVLGKLRGIQGVLSVRQVML